MTTMIDTPRTAATPRLLAAGVVAPVLFAGVALAQVFTRAGFDLLRHPLSMLSTGDPGWLQIANFLVTGALVIAGGVGLRRALRGHPGGTWAPRLIVIYGIGLVAAGIFSMDPGDGFPAGTPLGAPTSMSWHALLHMVAGSVAFTALIAACFVLGRYFSRTGNRAFAVASRLSGAIFLVGDVWAMTGGYAGSLTLCIGSLVALGWVGVVAATASVSES